MFFIKVVRCSCGFTARNQDWKPNSEVRIPHPGCNVEKSHQNCDEIRDHPPACGEIPALKVRVVSHPYPAMFRKGEQYMVFAPGTLRFKRDDGYPLRRLHEVRATVKVLEEGPDAHGIIMVKPPFGDDLPVLYSVLKQI